jgi:hypothetical protein
MKPTSARWLLLIVTVVAVALPLAAVASRSRFRAVRSLKARLLGARLLGDRGVDFQSGPADCGPTALRAVLALRGIRVPETARPANRGRVGWSPSEIVAASIGDGLYASAARTAPSGIVALELPAIALLGTHYVVIEARTSDGGFIVIDPDLGRMQAGIDYLDRDWTGQVVVFPQPKPNDHLRSDAAVPERHRSHAGTEATINNPQRSLHA